MVMRSLVEHLHAFIRDVQLREGEWEQAIDFLTRAGQISDDRRQELILLSDVLGASMQVVGVNHPAVAGVTDSTVFGPFFFEGAPRYENGQDIANGASGEPCFIEGQVRALGGSPIAGARVDVWEADDQGFYDSQYEDLAEPRGRGHLFTEDDGRFWLWSVRPSAYPIPDDGPVGQLLAAANRSPMRPAHIHFMVAAEGHETLITHVFESGDEHLGRDAVFGERPALITDFIRHEPGVAPDGRRLDTPFYSLAYEFVLMPSTPPSPAAA